ncbi:MAG: DUF1573 domain-containing protein, partial [Ignavibacteriales bacterium]|nr:DUF1573 domain-containing protein [Ignavibacteriales bacterium]
MPGRVFTFAVCTFLFSFLLHAQQIVINEIYNSSGNDEWIELLVIQDSLDLRNWDIRDFSAVGAPQSPLTFTTSSLWSLVRKGTIIVVATPFVALTEDTDPNDFLLQIKSSNALYFSGTVFAIAGSSDAVQIRNTSDTHDFGVSWGEANQSSIPTPKVHFSTGPASGNSIAFNEDTLPEMTNTSNWNTAATSTRGVGNTSMNSEWITSLRTSSTGDGSGTATIDPDTMDYGDTSTLEILYKRNPSYNITDIRIVLPSNFSWSHSTSDISFTNMTATKSVNGDTIYLNAISMSADSTFISILSVSAPESTAIYPVIIQTKAQIGYANVVPLPSIVVFGLPVPISEIKDNDETGILIDLGHLKTIRGVVTVASEFGGPAYVQDNSGGIAVYSSSFSTVVSLGDEVIVSGVVSQFYGLSELINPTLHQVMSSGNTVEPLVVTTSQIKNDGSGGIENYEGMLVRVNTTIVRDTLNNPISTWAVTGSGTNYRLIDATDYVDIRVDDDVNFANTPAPQGTFNVIGVVSQFKSSAPFIGGYQLMPRSSDDILASGPLFVAQPWESNITSTSFRINWQTIHAGLSRLRYGQTTSYEMGILEPDDVLRTSHAVDVGGLQNATIYHVQAFSVADGDTSTAGDLMVSTASPLSSTGQSNVYFNKSIDASVSSGEIALGNQDLVSHLLQRINNSKRSIDAALYSLSGTAGATIASALVTAKGRGVKIRVIGEYDNRGTAPWSTLTSNGIPVIFDYYGSNDGEGYQHNKFVIVDYRGGSPESIWVWTGSWNPTDPGTNNDRQNVIEIQDVSLAGAYTTEFNEMWGSTTDIPNSTASRFGSRKSNNTPHNFIINGIPIKLFFSPTDNTTYQIRTTLAESERSISSCLLTLTRKDLADTLIVEKNLGGKVRIVMDNNTDANSQYSYMLAAGIDVHLKGGSGLLHHKYAIIDADWLGESQYVITGSHNWSNSAEYSNDENTLIVEDDRITNLYLQEFAARYYEAGGTDSIRLSALPVFSVSSESLDFGNVQIYTLKKDSLTVFNIGAAELVISNVSSTDSQFTMAPLSSVIDPSDSQKFYITFEAQDSGQVSGSIIFEHNGLSSPDTINVDGEVINMEVSDTMIVSSGWNMISLPVKPTDGRKDILFPTSISKAFAYEGSYVQKDTLENGAGYW